MTDLFENPKVGDKVFVLIGRTTKELEPGEIVRVNAKSIDVKFRGRYRRDNGKEVGGDAWWSRSILPNNEETRSRYQLQQHRKEQKSEWEALLTSLKVRVDTPGKIGAHLPELRALVKRLEE